MSSESLPMVNFLLSSLQGILSKTPGNVPKGPHINTLPRNFSYVTVKILKAKASISEGPIELSILNAI